MTDSPGNRPPILELVRAALGRAGTRGLDLEQVVELATRPGWPEADVRSVIAGLVTVGELELEEVPERRTRGTPFDSWTRVRAAVAR